MTEQPTPTRRRRRLAALALGLTTLPAIGFALYRTYAGADAPADAVAITSGAISAEGGDDVDAVLPEDLTERLVQIDEETFAGNPYVTFSAAPRPTTPAAQGLQWPVASRYRITSPFGRRGDGFHHGVDIGCPLGAPVLAAGAGTVVWTGDAPVYGNLVVVHHGGGTVTLYAHLDRFAVREGDGLIQGQPLGVCGTTGRSTGPHLHFEVRYGGKAWDPLRFLPQG